MIKVICITGAWARIESIDRSHARCFFFGCMTMNLIYNYILQVAKDVIVYALMRLSLLCDFCRLDSSHHLLLRNQVINPF